MVRLEIALSDVWSCFISWFYSLFYFLCLCYTMLSVGSIKQVCGGLQQEIKSGGGDDFISLEMLSLFLLTSQEWMWLIKRSLISGFNKMIWLDLDYKHSRGLWEITIAWLKVILRTCPNAYGSFTAIHHAIYPCFYHFRYDPEKCISNFKIFLNWNVIRVE